MDKLNIFIINTNLGNENFILKIDSYVNVIINIYNLCNYKINNNIKKINKIIDIYNKISNINIYFYNVTCSNKLVTQFHDVLYNYKKKYIIKLFNCTRISKLLLNELFLYKNIVMDPNKNPDTYLKYIVSRIPNNYNVKIFNANISSQFPLTKAVGMGSKYNSYFVHIFDNKLSYDKNLYLIGKAITFDTGGLNLKSGFFGDMKVDMIGSGILISVINLLCKNNISTNYNIHLLLPIAENMIGNNALRPGMVLNTLSNKTIEINNTDAEGRLCIVDSIEYAFQFIKNNDIIIDIATLTGNTDAISSGISSIGISNVKGEQLLNKLIIIGEDIGEYLDKIKIRHEYMDLLKSNVADIKNCNENDAAGCIVAGAFLNYFIDNIVPWIHIDLGCSTFTNDNILSYGVNLLYEFIKQL
jgi:leucyl aminopeptidase